MTAQNGILVFIILGARVVFLGIHTVLNITLRPSMRNMILLAITLSALILVAGLYFFARAALLPVLSIF